MQAIDNGLLRSMVQTYESAPVLWTVSRWLTEAGGAVALCAITAFAALGLLARGDRRRATALLSVTLGGRAMVEVLKWTTDRPRPHLLDFPVTVHSLSFPSGHAANSLITYLALALLVVPHAAGRWPVIAAVLLSVAIGLTRPILGVHWPTDVVGGWAFGLAWTLGAVWLIRGWMERRPAVR